MSKIKLNTFHLKIIALICMVVDHFAYIFLAASTPAYVVMRCVGRLAAPIFWFCLAEGYKHTSNKGEYLKRLFFSSLIMGLGNMLISIFLDINISFTTPNMFFAMTLMIVIIELISMIRNEKTLYLRCLSCISLVFAVLAILQLAEYKAFILASVLIFYFVENKFLKCSLFCCFSFILSILYLNIYQMFMMFAVIFFIFYSNEKPKHSLKFFFYIFYPIHFWILCIICYLIQ